MDEILIYRIIIGVLIVPILWLYFRRNNDSAVLEKEIEGLKKEKEGLENLKKEFEKFRKISFLFSSAQFSSQICDHQELKKFVHQL